MQGASVIFVALLAVIVANSANTLGSPIAEDSFNTINYAGSNQKPATQYLSSVASIQTTSQHLCNAAILSKRYVITVAHCVAFKSASALRIRVGSDPVKHNAGPTVGGARHEVAHVRHHPKFDSFRRGNDIALIRSRTQFAFGEFVSAIALGSLPIHAATNAKNTGWMRKLKTGSSDIAALLQLSTQTIPNADCKKLFASQPSRASNIQPSNICARSTCTIEELNSGSELIVNGNLVGLRSWHASDCSSRQPDVYVRVHSYEAWIKQNM